MTMSNTIDAVKAFQDWYFQDWHGVSSSGHTGAVTTEKLRNYIIDNAKEYSYTIDSSIAQDCCNAWNSTIDSTSTTTTNYGSTLTTDGWGTYKYSAPTFTYTYIDSNLEPAVEEEIEYVEQYVEIPWEL